MGERFIDTCMTLLIWAVVLMQAGNLMLKVIG